MKVCRQAGHFRAEGFHLLVEGGGREGGREGGRGSRGSVYFIPLHTVEVCDYNISAYIYNISAYMAINNICFLSAVQWLLLGES